MHYYGTSVPSRLVNPLLLSNPLAHSFAHKLASKGVQLLFTHIYVVQHPDTILVLRNQK
jgi:hypothetical protein